MRVWKEDSPASPVRVRITMTGNDSEAEHESAVVASVDEAVDVVRRFLEGMVL